MFILIPGFLLNIGVFLLAPALPIIEARFGVSAGVAGLSFSAWALGKICVDSIAGWLADRIPYRWLASGGLALVAISSACAAVSDSFPMLLSARFIQGGGSAVAVTAMVTSVIVPGRLSRTSVSLAAYQATAITATALGPAVGGFVVTSFGLGSAFVLQAILAMLASGVALAHHSTPSPSQLNLASASKQSNRKDNRRQLFAHPAWWISILVTVLMQWIRAGVNQTAAPLLLHQHFHVSVSHVGVLLTIISGATVPFVLHSAKAIDSWGRRPVMIWTTLLSGLGIALLPTSRNWWQMSGILAVTATFNAYSNVTMPAIVGDISRAEVRGTAVGFNRLADDVGSFSGPIFVAAMSELEGYDGSVVAAGIVVIASAALMWRWMPETAPPRVFDIKIAAPDEAGSSDGVDRMGLDH